MTVTGSDFIPGDWFTGTVAVKVKVFPAPLKD
jgi:hypothetical protein